MKPSKSFASVFVAGLLAAALVVPAPAFGQEETPEDWNPNTYLKKFMSAMGTSQQKPRGIPGGEPMRVEIPGGGDAFALQEVIVYHTDDRVYGLQFGYEYGPGGPQESEIIGRATGERSVVPVSRETPPHYLRGHYGPDPDGHYTTPVLTGVSLGVYELNVLTDDAADGRPHDEMIEVHRFGDTDAGTATPPEGVGFDLYYVQAIRAINACVSPLDRNGRIFSLGVQRYGMMGDRAVEPVTCDDGNGSWRRQPLGPPRLVASDPFGKEEPLDAEDDPYEFFSGMYRKEGDQFSRVLTGDPAIDGDNNTLAARWKMPQHLIVEFGDTAKIRFENVPVPTFNLPLVTDPAARRTDQDYAFQYAASNAFIGVSYERIGDDYVAYVTFDYEGAGGAPYVGRYAEVPLGDGLVAKRHRERAETAARQQSKKGLFELGSIKDGVDYIYAGHDGPTMNPWELHAGLRAKIFTESGEYQYYIDGAIKKGISDGLVYRQLSQSSIVGTTVVLSTAKEVAETNSKNIGATVPVKGVPVGASYSQSTSSGMNSSQKQMKAMTVARALTSVFLIDKPNAFFDPAFVKDVRDFYRAPASRHPDLARAMVAKYGTHWSAAVTFGGIGINEQTVTSKEYGTRAAREYKVSAKVGDDKMGGADAGMSEGKSRTAQSFSEFGREEFKTRGGSAGGSSGAWTVSVETAEPVLYDLRPLSELMEPIALSKILDPADPSLAWDGDKVRAMRDALDTAIGDRFSEFPVPSTESTAPHIYRLSVSNFRCTDGGDDEDSIELDGDLKLETNDGGGNATHTIFSGSETSVNCNSTAVGSGLEIYLWYDKDQTHANGQQIYPVALVASLVEDDDSFIDTDDVVKKVESLAALPLDFEPVKGVVLFGGGKGGDEPSFAIDYEWQRVE